MALCMPFPLRQRTFRVYQNHLSFPEGLTSFVPPIHNQGVSLAPLQGPALWKIFLPTTGSFFVSILTDLFCRSPLPAPFGGRFPGLFLHAFSFPITAEFNSQIILPEIQFNCNRSFFSLSFCFLCCLHLWSSDITHQLLCVIVNAFYQDCVEDPQYLTGNCNY